MADRYTRGCTPHKYNLDMQLSASDMAAIGSEKLISVLAVVGVKAARAVAMRLGSTEQNRRGPRPGDGVAFVTR